VRAGLALPTLETDDRAVFRSGYIQASFGGNRANGNLNRAAAKRLGFQNARCRALRFTAWLSADFMFQVLSPSNAGMFFIVAACDD